MSQHLRRPFLGAVVTYRSLRGDYAALVTRTYPPTYSNHVDLVVFPPRAPYQDHERGTDDLVGYREVVPQAIGDNEPVTDTWRWPEVAAEEAA